MWKVERKKDKKGGGKRDLTKMEGRSVEQRKGTKGKEEEKEWVKLENVIVQITLFYNVHVQICNNTNYIIIYNYNAPIKNVGKKGNEYKNRIQKKFLQSKFKFQSGL